MRDPKRTAAAGAAPPTAIQRDETPAYRDIVDQALQGVAIVQDGRVVFANPAVTRLTGYSQSELLALSPEDLQGMVHPEDHERLVREFRDRGEALPERSEIRLRHKDGELAWAEIYINAVHWGGREAIQYSYVDITARKLAEQRLHESEQRFARFFLSSPNPTLITSLEDGRIVDINASFEAVTGHRREAVIGQSAADLGFFLGREFIPEVLNLLRERDSLRAREMPFRGLQGDERMGLLSAQAVTIAGERCAIWQGVDVTEQKRAESDLRASEARFRLLAESAKEYVAELDVEGRFLYLSPSLPESLGYQVEEFVGRLGSEFMPEIIHADDLALVTDAMARSFSGEPMPPTLYRVRHKGGAWRWVETTGRPIAMPDGTHHLVSLTRDVTDRVRAQEERKRLEEQVLQSRKLEELGVLAGGIAHDFNNLLVGVQGNAELALRELLPEHPAHASLLQLLLAAERAAELTRELLAYAGKARVSIEDVDLAVLAAEMARHAGTRHSDVAIEMASDGSPCWVQADATQIRRVVLNLVTNAVEAIGDDSGTVRVLTGIARLGDAELASCLVAGGVPPGEYAFVEVADDGCGIDPDTLSRIFDPFYTTKFQGRGLGLAGVLGIVRSHGGTLRVESEPGCGTDFRVYFPRCEPPRTQEAAAVPDEPAGSERGMLLVVDDEPSVRDVTRRLLESRGFQVLVAASGAEAVEIARRKGATLRAVLLDVTMPGMDGDATFEALRAIRPDLPVVFISGHSEEDVARRLHGRTRVDNAPKPFRVDALVAKIRRVSG